MLVKHIVCCNKLGYIGNDNKLLYHIPNDLKHFRQTTENSTVIMGYNTYVSIGSRPLPNRKNIVLTSKRLLSSDKDLVFVDGINKAMAEAATAAEVYIIGGGQLYQSTLDMVDEVILTLVEDSTVGDSKYPLGSITQKNFDLVEVSKLDDPNYKVTVSRWRSKHGDYISS